MVFISLDAAKRQLVQEYLIISSVIQTFKHVTAAVTDQHRHLGGDGIVLHHCGQPCGDLKASMLNIEFTASWKKLPIEIEDL